MPPVIDVRRPSKKIAWTVSFVHEMSLRSTAFGVDGVIGGSMVAAAFFNTRFHPPAAGGE